MENLRVASLCLLLDLLTAFLVKELLSCLLQLAGQAIDLILVVPNLSLVSCELCCHCLHLLRFSPQAILESLQLFHYLWPRLLLQKRCELSVQPLFFRDLEVFCDDLFSFAYETLLEHAHLLDEFVDSGIRAFKLAPSVNIHRILQLLRQGLRLGALLQQLTLQVIHLFLVAISVLSHLRRYEEVHFQLGDGLLRGVYLLQALLVLHLSFLQCAFLDLDLLIKEIELLVPSDELRAQDVPLAGDTLELFPLILPLDFGLLNGGFQLLDFILLLANNLLQPALLLLMPFQVVLCFLLLLANELVLKVLSYERLVFLLDLFLKLLDLQVHLLELCLHLGYLLQ
mmetsp:Transcript_22795/g.52098  ORF Transcript_22795/g.52098 Transcript_22795/m.52098 type:complete len:341 (+) Transcript_22795:141-1163(+)